MHHQHPSCSWNFNHFIASHCWRPTDTEFSDLWTPLYNFLFVLFFRVFNGFSYYSTKYAYDKDLQLSPLLSVSPHLCMYVKLFHIKSNHEVKTIQRQENYNINSRTRPTSFSFDKFHTNIIIVRAGVAEVSNSSPVEWGCTSWGCRSALVTPYGQTCKISCYESLLNISLCQKKLTGIFFLNFQTG